MSEKSKKEPSFAIPSGKKISKKPVKKSAPVSLQKVKKEFFYKRYEFHAYLLWIIMSFLLTLFIVPSLGIRVASIQVGDISATDIKAPLDYTVEDQETTKLRQKEAEQSVLPVYDYNERLSAELAEKLHKLFEYMLLFYNQKNSAMDMQDSNQFQFPKTKKKNSMTEKGSRNTHNKELIEEWNKFIQEKGLTIDYPSYLIFERYTFDRAIEEGMATILREIMSKDIIPSYSFSFNESERGLLKRNLGTRKETKIKDVLNILDLKAAQKLLYDRELSLYPEDKRLPVAVRQVLKEYIKPNLTFNLSETQNRTDLARKSVKPVFFQIKKGEMIIREGERARTDQVEKLNALNKMKNQGNIFQTFLKLTIIVSLTLMMLFILLLRFKSGFISHFQNLLLISLCIIITIVIIRICMFIAHGLPLTIPLIPPQSYYFAFPFATASILIAILLDVEIAIMVAAIMGILSGILLNRDLGFFILTFLGSLGGIYVLSSRKSRSHIVKSGLMVGLINLGVIISYHSLQGNFLSLEGLFNAIFGFLGGMTALALVLAFLPILEPLFHLATDTTLLQLLNLNHPLLHRLSIETPGTYHHCIVVANLAEAAADAINANSLFARVAAYYHDIGKIKMPRYYIENQMNFKNEHENLAPSMSSLILISHVKDGVELGEKYRLTRPIIDIIQQHHGTSLIKFFYAKAKGILESEGQEVKEEDYRYPGPKPQTKEAGIVMLADAVEATSRTLTEPKPSRIQGMIQNTINNIFRDGQLDECELTLKDLHQIASSFNLILSGIFHPRITYPDQNGTEEGRKERGGDLYPKSSKEAKTGQALDQESGREDIRRLGISNPGSEYNTRK